MMAAVVLLASCSSSSETNEAPAEKTASAKEIEPPPPAKTPSVSKPSRDLTSGNLKTVTTALTADGGIDGNIPEDLLSRTLNDLAQVVSSEPENVPLMVTYMGLLRLYGQSPQMLRDVERKAGAFGAKSPWYLIEAAYGALNRKDFAFAEYLLAKAVKNAPTNPLVKNAVTHATAVRYILDGKLQVGLVEMKKAAQGEIPFLPSTLTLGFQYLKVGDYESAEKMFRNATAAAPYSVGANLGLAAALRVRGKAAEALPLLQRLYKQRPQDRRIVWNLAVTLGDGDAAQKQQAIGLLDKYFQLPGSLPEIDARANAMTIRLTNELKPTPTPAPAQPAAPSDAAAAGAQQAGTAK
jgi:tetratricopeptide (TPR) repeat protein